MGGDPTSQLVTAHQNGTGGANTVLRVIVESLLYPVSLEILHQIFQRFGKVLKIVTFTKNNSFQALIQYPDAQTAQHAKQTLDGQNIYNGCCTLRIDNSKLTALNVKYNNDKSRDFTNPTLPAGEPGSDLIASAGGLVNASDLLLLAAGQRPALTRDRLGKCCRRFKLFDRCAIIVRLTDMKFYVRKLYVSFCSKWHGNTWSLASIYGNRIRKPRIGQCLWQRYSELRCICFSIVRCSWFIDTRCFTWIIQRFIGIQFKWRGKRPSRNLDLITKKKREEEKKHGR